VITPATLGSIVACAPEGSRDDAAGLLASVCAAAGVTDRIAASHDVAAAHDRSWLARRALIAIDDLEDLATRRARVEPHAYARHDGAISLRVHRAILALRAMVARGRPAVHDRGEYLTDDELGGEPRWWPIGARVAVNDNDNKAKERRPAP
jgi:hypothetical protein